ncbi:unnamed protein product [Thlaspi arvense]|uniref:Uncharacterized protein n=1 Tax=Thlaspi arvense TaxID=13288 RepID=A0AAU9RDD6_THLAR|nr:unnamed protein product [Thlaspi arvense]
MSRGKTGKIVDAASDHNEKKDKLTIKINSKTGWDLRELEESRVDSITMKISHGYTKSDKEMRISGHGGPHPILVVSSLLDASVRQMKFMKFNPSARRIVCYMFPKGQGTSSDTLTFAWVNFFFSGFVSLYKFLLLLFHCYHLSTTKIPIPLTQSFGSMLLNGIDLITVDVSYVSSRS